ncbi:MAG: ATP-binding protein [Deltaproteobacteria bacterium]|nr:ATP-binding protein [Deltaproteobacteria bacterium]
MSVLALREALALAPGNVPLRVLLARELLAADRVDDAIVEARAAFAADPARRDTREVLGACGVALGDDAVVVEAWFPVRDQLDASSLRALAVACARTGQLAESREVYALISEVEPVVHDLALRRAVVASAPLPPPEKPPERHPTFADVGGLESLKERLRMDIVYPLQRPDLFRAYGKKLGGGVLLYGPPGCGKTHLARAAAGESGARFVVVEIQAVLEMWLGESEKRLHEVFEEARAKAPSILFFDEVEAIGAARHQLRHGPGRRLVNQLLAEMDGAGANNDGLLVIGATNAPWDVDPALRRPGRFDRVVFVPPPDPGARETILQLALRDRPTEMLDLRSLIGRTHRWSGADLHHLVDAASERALAEALRSGKLRPITQSDLVAAIDRVRPTTGEWLAAAKRYVSYANQAGLYDDVAAYLRED